MKKILLIISLLAYSLNAVGRTSETITEITEQIKKANDQIKLATDSLNQFDKMNQTLTSAENAIFNTGEKIFNPKKSLERMIASGTRLAMKDDFY